MINWLKKLFGDESPPKKDEINKLSQLLTQHFTLSEIRTLCFDLGINFDALPGESKPDKARALVSSFSRPPHSLDEFIQACSQMYSDIPWNDPDSIESQMPNRNRQTSLFQMIHYSFNVNELRDLCLDLGLDYENLPGGSKKNKVRELIFCFSRSPRNIDQLIQTCSELRPNAPWDTPQATKYEPHNITALAKLRRMLTEHVDEDGTRELAKSLGIDYKRLPGADQGGTARELILYLARRERLNELIELCVHRFPNIPWQETVDSPDEQRTSEQTPEPIQTSKLQQALATLSEDQLRDLCLELGTDYDDIIGPNKVPELMSYFERRGSMPELVEVCTRLYPERDWID